MRTIPTVEELNAIQKEWMNLQPDAPKAEKQRVFKLMESLPGCYVSGHDGRGACILDGQPLSMAVPFEDALERCKQLGGRIDIAWNGKAGQFYSIL